MEPTRFRVEIDREVDGRWIADVVEIPGAMAYGATEEEAKSHAVAIALHAIADRLEHGEAPPEPLRSLFKFIAAA